MAKKPEYRWNGDGRRARKMAEADGYVMARYTGCIPFVRTVKEWEAMSLEPPATGSAALRGVANAVHREQATLREAMAEYHDPLSGATHDR